MPDMTRATCTHCGRRILRSSSHPMLWGDEAYPHQLVCDPGDPDTTVHAPDWLART